MKLFFIGIAGIITTILLTIFGVYWYTPMEDQKPISVQEKIQKLIQGTSPGVVTVLRLHLTGE